MPLLISFMLPFKKTLNIDGIFLKVLPHIVLRFWFYAHVLRLGVKKAPTCLCRKSWNHQSSDRKLTIGYRLLL